MGSRSAFLEDTLPAVEIECFEVEAPRPFLRPPTPRPAIPFRPSGYEALARLRRRYEAAIGAYRDFHPRLQSTVEHRVAHPVDVVVEMLFLHGATYDPLEHEYRVPVQLHLTWSWPDLPIWLTVGELSATKCALRLSLRSHRRIRYPKRYFTAAHAALRALESYLDQQLVKTATTHSG
jgi:hypothetical protein